jgi:hypothetical protein
VPQRSSAETSRYGRAWESREFSLATTQFY